MALAGQCKLLLGPKFEEVIIKAVYENEPLPIHAVLECDYILNNLCGEKTGRINIFVRLSCFGSTIVTQFQLSGTEHQDYIFKTSKKDNTIEAQKKKDFPYGDIHFKNETVRKQLVNKHDISPLQPIFTDENTFYPPTEASNFDETNKHRPWSKCMKICGCDNSDEELLEEGYDKENKNLSMNYCPCGQNNMSKPSRPPCPVPDCDCYSTNNDEHDKCALSGCNCYDPKSMRQSQQSYPQENQRKSLLNRRSCCSPYSFSKQSSQIRKNNKTVESQRISTQMNNKCNCDCYNIKQKQNDKPLNLRSLSNSFQNCVSQERKSLDINKYLMMGQTYRANQNLEQAAIETQHDIESCFFADLHQSRAKLPQNNSVCNPCRSRPTQFTNSGEQKNTLTNCCDCNCCGRGDTNLRRSIGNGTSSAGHTTANIASSFAHTTAKGSLQGSRYSSSVTKNCEDFAKFSNVDTDKTNLYGPLSPCNKDQKQIQKEQADLQAGSVPQPDEKDKESISSLQPQDGGKQDNRKNGDEVSLSSLDKSAKSFSSQQRTQDKRKRSSSQKETGKSQQIYNEIDKTQPTHHGGGDSLSEKDLLITKRKRKQNINSINRYTAGMFPGNLFGHRHCIKEFRFVPKTMGWLWNIADLGDGLAIRRGWMPGAINKTVTKVMKKGKKAGVQTEKQEEVTPPKTPKTPKKKRHQTRSGYTISSQNTGDDDERPQSPTLHVHKKDGAYFISVNPLKADSDEDEDVRSPLMFKILPHDDEQFSSSDSSLEIEFTAPGAFRKIPKKQAATETDIQGSDADSAIEIAQPPAGKGKKGTTKHVETQSTKTPSESKDKSGADQSTQAAKVKK